MTGPEMVNRVNMLLDKINSFQADTLLESEVYTALNIAQENFVKQRFGRANKYGKGFEENQKRMDDIAPLILDAIVQPDYSEDVGNGFYRDIVCQLPATATQWMNTYSENSANPSPDQWTTAKYMFLVSVRAHVRYRNCNNPLVEDVDWTYTIPPGTETVTSVVDGVEQNFEEDINQFSVLDNNEVNIQNQGRRTMISGAPGIQVKHGVLCKYVQNDDIFELLKDPFNTTDLDGPKYTMSGFVGHGWGGEGISPTHMNRSQIEIYTDNTFIVQNVAIRYVKQPDEIRSTWQCQLADHTHMEIVNMAVDLLLESMSDPRYKSHQMETLKSD